MSDMLRAQLREAPISTVLGLWGTGLALTGLYLHKRQLPLQLKIIQARIVAQWGLVGMVGSFAAVALLSGDGGGDRSQHTPAASSWKVRQFEKDMTLSEGDAARPAMGSKRLAAVRAREAAAAAAAAAVEAKLA